jgi:hypothetical protein
MLVPRVWCRRLWLSECSAALVALYTGRCARGTKARRDVTFTIAASGRARIAGTNARDILRVPSRFTSTSLNAAGAPAACVRKSTFSETAALLTRMLTRPACCSAIAATCTGSDTSQQMASAPRSARRARSSRSRSRPQMTISLPSRLNAAAMASPIPEPPPVIRTRCLVSCIGGESTSSLLIASLRGRILGLQQVAVERDTNGSNDRTSVQPTPEGDLSLLNQMIGAALLRSERMPATLQPIRTATNAAPMAQLTFFRLLQSPNAMQLRRSLQCRHSPPLASMIGAARRFITAMLLSGHQTIQPMSAVTASAAMRAEPILDSAPEPRPYQFVTGQFERLSHSRRVGKRSAQ